MTEPVPPSPRTNPAPCPRRDARKIAGTLLLAGLALSCGTTPAEPTPPAVEREMSSYTDLLRQFEENGTPGNRQKIVVWTLEEDSRRALFLHPPRRLELELPALGEHCVLRFGMGLRPETRQQSDGVSFRIEIPSRAENPTLYEELVEPDQATWLDREVPLPASSEGSTIVLETGPGPAGDASYDHAAWSAPHVRCLDRAVPTEPPPLILLVSIDTLRADHLPIYGYPRDTAPALSKLAERSLVFDAAFSPAPYTLPSHASLLTGAPAEIHGAGFAFPTAAMNDTVPTVAGALSEAGFETIGLTAGGLAGRKYGLARGFSTWYEYTRASLGSVLPLVLDHLTARREPTFLFLHTYDVHGPYHQPEAHRYFRSSRERPTEAGALWQRALEMPYHGYQELDRFGSPQDVVDAYDSGIRYADQALSELFGVLETTGELESAWIFVTSDHGETLFDLGRYFGHSWTLSDRELRVPLIVKTPGFEHRGRRSDQVRLVDVAAQIVSAAGLAPLDDVEGRPLVGGETDHRLVTGGSSHLGTTFARSPTWKLVEAPSSAGLATRARVMGEARGEFPRRAQIYRLREDPEERKNLVDSTFERDADLGRVRSALAALPRPGQGEEPTPEGEEHETLKALGYVQ